MTLFFVFLLSSTLINTVVGPNRWRRPSSNSEHEESSGSSSTAVSYQLHPTTSAVVVEQPDSEDGRPGVPAVGYVTMPEITLEQRIMASDLYSTKEYGRLYGIVQRAITKNWKYKSRLDKAQVEANRVVPWLADAGILIGENTFIRYCAASLVHESEWSSESNVLITSAPCGLMLELAKDQARLRFYWSEVPEYREVVSIHYYQDYAPATHPNLAVLMIQPIELPDQSSRLIMPHFVGDIQPGRIVWRSDNYEKRSKISRTIPVRVHHVKAKTVEECPHCQGHPSMVVIKPDGNDTSETDLGGSPFYEVVPWGFLRGHREFWFILRGIRTSLEGDHFTRIDQFVPWINQMFA